MVDTSTAELTNTLASTDSTTYLIPPTFNNNIRLRNLSVELIKYDATGYFKLDSSTLDGPDVLPGTIENLSSETLIFNDNSTYIETFGDDSTWDTFDWTINRTNGTISITGNPIISNKIVNDGNSYTSATISLINGSTEFYDNININIITDSGTYNADFDTTISFPSTEWLKFSLFAEIGGLNLPLTLPLVFETGSSGSTNYINQLGKPTLIKISYK